MNESTRLAYLDRMGVVSYQPRFILPGAALSPQLAVDEQVETVDVIARAPVPEIMPSSVARAEEETEAVPVRRAVDIDFSELQPQKTKSAPIAAPPAGQKNDAPAFHAELVCAGQSVMFVFDGVKSAASQRLLNNISLAIQQSLELELSALSSVAQFDWPMVKMPGIAQDAAAASDAFSACILATLQRYQIPRVIMFGELGKFCQKDNICVDGHSLFATLDLELLQADSAAKRALWQQVLAWQQQSNVS